MSTSAIQQPYEGQNRDIDDWFGLHVLSTTEIATRRGVAYRSWFRVTLGALGYYRFKMSGPSHYVVLRRRVITTGGPVTLKVIEGATITSETPVQVASFNLDRLNTTPSIVHLITGITAYTGGTVVDYDFRPSTGTPGQGIGAESSAISLTRYDAHNPIIGEFYNETGQAIEVYYELIWYEHELKGL